MQRNSVTATRGGEKVEGEHFVMANDRMQTHSGE